MERERLTSIVATSVSFSLNLLFTSGELPFGDVSRLSIDESFAVELQGRLFVVVVVVDDDFDDVPAAAAFVEGGFWLFVLQIIGTHLFTFIQIL